VADFDSVILGEKGHLAAQAAIASLSKYKLLPSPQHYAVWLAYHTKLNPDLVSDVDRVLASDRPFDDTCCSALHRAYFEETSLEANMLKAGGKFADEMRLMMKGIETADARTRAYGEQLEIARKELSSSPTPMTAKHLVENLTSATVEMVQDTHDLRAKLTDSSLEIKALRQQLDKVRVEAQTDALTGLANRKAFEARYSELAAASEAGGGPLSLILCDIDFFKRVNDSFGHQTGDQVIRFVGTVMDRSKPEGGLVARMGGEEFALLAPNTSLAAAAEIAERIRLAVESKKLVRRSSNEDLGKITVSLGVSQRQMKEKGTSLVERTDEALYSSKRRGRNKVTVDQPKSLKAA
jgi:diguanylate cyclase